MPTKSVKVRFRFKGGPTWRLPKKIKLANGKSYTLNYSLTGSSSDGAALTSVNFPDGDPPGFTASGAQITGTNSIGGSAPEDFSYTVTVTYNNTPYTSEDPELELDPP
jgi:hypothetical protein